LRKVIVEIQEPTKDIFSMRDLFPERIGLRLPTESHTEAALVNGSPGVVVRRLDGSLMGVMACTVVDDRIVAIESVSDPDLLTGMGLR
ncbi:hypothetical protein ACFQ1S_45570, partial [Kibdelosporangium lantanae]